MKARVSGVFDVWLTTEKTIKGAIMILLQFRGGGGERETNDAIKDLFLQKKTDKFKNIVSGFK